MCAEQAPWTKPSAELFVSIVSFILSMACERSSHTDKEIGPQILNHFSQGYRAVSARGGSWIQMEWFQSKYSQSPSTLSLALYPLHLKQTFQQFVSIGSFSSFHLSNQAGHMTQRMCLGWFLAFWNFSLLYCVPYSEVGILPTPPCNPAGTPATSVAFLTCLETSLSASLNFSHPQWQLSKMIL